MPVPEPDPAAEPAASTGQDRSACEGRSRPRVPRLRPCSAMAHVPAQFSRPPVGGLASVTVCGSPVSGGWITAAVLELSVLLVSVTMPLASYRHRYFRRSPGTDAGGPRVDSPGFGSDPSSCASSRLD